VSLSKHQAGYVEGVLSAVVTAALFGLKLCVGRESGSVALVADAWHPPSDTLTSLVVIFGSMCSCSRARAAFASGHTRCVGEPR
jgi:divalent metal cation (Fe/Co/Zn/Cd) transporter